MNEYEYIRKALSGLHASENTLEAVMKKASKRNQQGKFCYVRKSTLITAVLIILSFTVACTAAVIKWGGFAFTDGMSDSEKNALIKDATMLYARDYQDENGNVHYLDENGDEVLVLSAADAAKYELERQAAREQAVLESTTLVDASTLPFIPHIITELTVDADGQFAECALGNASMILLHPAEKDGFDLKVGDVVTITLDANDRCILEFGQFKDGTFADVGTAFAQQHSYSFTIKEPGLYCFSIEYRSAGVSTFTNCTITVE